MLPAEQAQIGQELAVPPTSAVSELSPGPAPLSRTSPLARGAPLRWSYTERWAVANATLSATENWLLAFGQQPRCMHGLQPGDRLAETCFPRVAPDAGASGGASPLVGTSLLPRLALTLAHQLAVASGGGGGGGLTLALWWRSSSGRHLRSASVRPAPAASPGGRRGDGARSGGGRRRQCAHADAACVLCVLLLRQRLDFCAPPAANRLSYGRRRGGRIFGSSSRPSSSPSSAAERAGAERRTTRGGRVRLLSDPAGALTSNEDSAVFGSLAVTRDPVRAHRRTHVGREVRVMRR